MNKCVKKIFEKFERNISNIFFVEGGGVEFRRVVLGYDFGWERGNFT